MTPEDEVNEEKPSPHPYAAKYAGSGSAEDPFVVVWDQDDPENPRNWHSLKKWLLTAQVTKPNSMSLFSLACKMLSTFLP